MKNKYMHRSRVSEHKFRHILECFCDDLSTIVTAKVTGLSRRSISKYYCLFRKRIFELTTKKDEKLSGEVEIDESYFGPRRVRGKRGRGAGKKVLVLGILKRGGKVHTQIIPNAKKESIMPIIQGKVLDQTTVHTDGWRSYDGGKITYQRHREFLELCKAKN